jgi:hypothetical protein
MTIPLRALSASAYGTAMAPPWPRSPDHVDERGAAEGRHSRHGSFIPRGPAILPSATVALAPRRYDAIGVPRETLGAPSRQRVLVGVPGDLSGRRDLA